MAEFDAVILPGQEGKIAVEIAGEKVSGRFTKTATVFSNDTKHPRMTISLAGEILYYVTVEPSTRLYLRGMFGEEVMNELTVSSGEKKGDFRILSLSSNIDDKITYRYEPAAEPGVYTVKIFKNPKLPTLNTWGSLKILTNSEFSPEKVVQINVATRGAIIVQPATINFGSIGDVIDGTGVEKSLTVFKVNGEFNIKNVEFTSDRYEAAVEPVQDGKRYKVTVKIHPGAEPQSYLDEMVINTDDPQEPALRVRLLARKL